jgi:hypothetical protein
MATVKRILGDYEIKSVGPTDRVIVTTDEFQVTGDTLITGNLTVAGNVTTTTSQETVIADPRITLGAGNTGSEDYLGIEVVKGPTDTDRAGIRWNDLAGQWEMSSDNSTWTAIANAGASYLINDPDPTLGAPLDTNGFAIIAPADVTIIPGSAQVTINNRLNIPHIFSDPTAEVGYTKLYAKATAGGAAGVYVSVIDPDSNVIQDELISKSKAIIYSIIF